MNGDGAVSGLDVDPFIVAVIGGGLTIDSVLEPSTRMMLLVALVMLEVKNEFVSFGACRIRESQQCVAVVPCLPVLTNRRGGDVPSHAAFANEITTRAHKALGA